jgi:hypothetical protein
MLYSMMTANAFRLNSQNHQTACSLKQLLVIQQPSVLIPFLQRSGIPLDVMVRFQINMALGDLRGTPRAAKFSNMVLPMLWTEFVSIYTQPCIPFNWMWYSLIIAELIWWWCKWFTGDKHQSTSKFIQSAHTREITSSSYAREVTTNRSNR